MKTILVSLTHIGKLADTLDAVVYLARQYDSHVIGYYPIPGIELSVFSGPGTEIPVSDTLKQFYQSQQPAVKAQFMAHMDRENINYEWRSDFRYEPKLHDGIIQHGREANLIVLTHDGVDEQHSRSDTGFIANIVLGAGRPVLIIPANLGRDFKIEKAAIGWNASREASRAAFDSLPLIRCATNTELFWVDPDKKSRKSDNFPATELAAALARHDVSVTFKNLGHHPKTGHAIVDYANESAIDLLVMGAYGRSRLSEQILGGATEHILRFMPCPVLMSH